MTSGDKWEVFAALPNIVLPDPATSNTVLNVEVRDIAMVRSKDQRVVEARRRSPPVEHLVSGFRTHTDEAYEPAVIIYRADAPATVKGPAFIDFRNAIALSIVLRSWSTESANNSLLYSDTFDIFPAYPTDSGRLLIITPATKSLYALGVKFLATPSPIGCLTPRYLAQDDYLARALAVFWCRCYQDGRTDRFSRSLFRSLEIAYAAAAAPMRHNTTENEWGINLALWVSAIEVLAHPRAHSRTGNVDQEEALRFLATYQWESKRLDAPRRTIWPRGKGKPPLRVNAIQSAYHSLYKARNAHLHGDKVLKRVMFPFKRAPKTSLVMVAPLIYRTALCAYLQKKVHRYPGFSRVNVDRDSAARTRFYIAVGERMRVNDALRRMLFPSKLELASDWQPWGWG